MRLRTPIPADRRRVARIVLDVEVWREICHKAAEADLAPGIFLSRFIGQVFPPERREAAE